MTNDKVRIGQHLRRNIIQYCIRVSVVLTVLITNPVQAEEIRGKVVSVADGDTITVLDFEKIPHKVRLQGIDAPEKAQAFGTKSKEKLSELIGNNVVIVRWEKKDRYGRILGEVFCGNHHINLEMVTEGMAWHYKQYSKSKQMADAENDARNAKNGLWADKSPVPPWEFRKKHKVVKTIGTGIRASTRELATSVEPLLTRTCFACNR